MYYAGEEVEITSSLTALRGHLHIPSKASAIVILASDSRPESAIFQASAATLHDVGIATMLLYINEDHSFGPRLTRTQNHLLSARLEDATDWLSLRPETRDLDLGYFGVGNSASAAMLCAAREPYGVAAVVAMNGIYELELRELEEIKAAVMLLAPAEDSLLQEEAKHAMRGLRSRKEFRLFSAQESSYDGGHELRIAAQLTTWFEKMLLPLHKRSVGSRELW